MTKICKTETVGSEAHSPVDGEEELEVRHQESEDGVVGAEVALHADADALHDQVSET